MELLGAPADGVTQVGYWTMPLAWDVKSARLEIIDPAVPESCACWRTMETFPHRSACGAARRRAEGLVPRSSKARSRAECADRKGKMVLTRENPAGMKWLLARKGAAGAINAFTENPDLKDDRQWINAWGDHGWAFTKDNAPLLCFSISPRQATYLRKLLAEGKTVRVRPLSTAATIRASIPT